MVKKLEKGSTVTSSNPQPQLNTSKNKIHDKKNLEQIKCSKKECPTSNCPTKLEARETLSKKQINSIKKRVCYKCREKGHSAADFSQDIRANQRAVRPAPDGG
jgi:hypothetical protein